MRTSLSCAQTLSYLGAVAVIIFMFFIPSAEAQTQTAPPTGIDLDFSSDLGTSNTDNITSDNTPTINVTGTLDGASVTIVATRSNPTDEEDFTDPSRGGTYSIIFGNSMSDGVWTFSATQRLPGEAESVPTALLAVTFDTAAPTITVTNPASQTEEATSRTFSAVDNDAETTMMYVAVQTENTCASSAPESAVSYTEGSNYVVTGLSNNNKYLCFWSEDVAGNVGKARSDRIQNLIEISATPDTPDLTTASDSGVDNDDITNDATPTFSVSGTVNGATVTVTATKAGENAVEGTAVASGTSTNVTLSSSLSDGTWSVSATQQSSGEAASVPTAPLTVTIDTTAPTVTVMNPDSQTEEATSRTFSANDNESGTTTMKVAVQSESTCNASAPGTAASYTEGSDYVVSGLNNNSKYLCFWSEDVAGNVGSERSNRIQNLTDISATPDTPDLTATSDSGVNNDDITHHSTPTFTVGSTVNGATVTVTATKAGENAVEGTATASGASTNVTLSSSLSDGIWSVSAAQTESGREESLPSSSLTVTIDTTTPTITVTNPAQTGEATSRTFSAGDNDSGTTTMKVEVQTASTCAASAPESAASYTEGSDYVVTGLSNNSKYLCFWSEDVAGNVGKARSDQIQNLIEISATPGTPDLATGSDSGVNNDNITNDSTPTFSVSGTVNGATVTVTATKGLSTVTGDATASGASTNVTFTTPLSDGIWSVSATQTESGGKNESPSSSSITVTIDATTPTVTVTNPTQTGEATSRTFSAGDDDSGTTTMEMRLQTESTCASPAPESAESYTEGSNYVVTGLSNNNKYLCFWSEDVAGNVGSKRSDQIQNLIEISATPGTPDLATGSDSGVNNDNITNDSTPTFSVSGTVNGATVTVTATKGLSTVTGDATASGASTNVTLPTLSDGIWSVSATQTETGGKNESPSSSSLTVTIDATAPTVTVTNPTQTGEATSRTFSAGDDDSGTTTMEMRLQTASTCASPAPESAESYTEGSDYVVTGLGNNSKYLCFWSEDVAGNVGKARSNQIQNLIEISATPGTPDLTTASDSGVNNDNITNNSTPTFSVSGTVNGATVTVTATKGLSTVTGDAIASGVSTDVTLPTLSDGIWSVSATQTESGGKNESPSSSSITVTIDATAPTVTVTNPTQTGEATSRTFSAGDDDSGTTTMEMRLQTENTCASPAPESAVSYTEGSDRVVTGLSNNSKYLCFWSEDVAGNVGKARSDRIQNLIEISATPGTPDLTTASDSGVNNDNITNNSTPTFSVSGTVNGATVTVTATKGLSTVEGTATASGASTNVTLPALSDGIWSVSATQTETGGKNESPSSATLTVTIDATAPTVTVTNPTQTGEATSRTFSAGDNDSGTTTMEMRLQTENTCAASAPESAESYTEGNDYVVTGLSNNSKYLCFWSEDVAGNVGKARSDRIQNLIEISATPGTPDLATGSDSGVNNDNITNDSTPTFSVGNTVNGATVTVTARKGLGNTITGDAIASGASTNVTFTTPLSDGIWSVSATQTESGGKNESPSSAALTVTIDTETPTVTETKFYEDRGLTTEIAPGSYRKQGDSVYAVITFSENVGHVEGDDSSARPYIAYHTSADSFYDIVGFNSNPLPDGDCQPNHATERNVYICRYDVESSVNDTFTVKVSTDTEDIAGNALASEYIHANTIYLDTTSPNNLVVNSATGRKKQATVTVTVDRGNPNIPDEIHLVFGGDCTAFGENGVSSSISVSIGTQTGQSHTFTVSAPKGSYDNCVVKVVDRAGNETSDVTIPSFRVRGSSGTVGGIRATSAPRLPGYPTHAALPSDTTALSRVETLFSQGQRDDRIRAMQVALNDTSCKVAATGVGSPGSESTYFGERTRSALACYQQQEGLSVTGIYDTATHVSLRQNFIRNRLIALFERYNRDIVDFFDERGLDLSVFGLRRSEL